MAEIRQGDRLAIEVTTPEGVVFLSTVDVVDNIDGALDWIGDPEATVKIVRHGRPTYNVLTS